MERWYEEGQDPHMPWESFALTFVQKLIGREYDAAWAMTSEAYRQEDTIEGLKRFTEKVLISQERTGPCYVLSSIEDWPKKENQVHGMTEVIVKKGQYENPEPITIMVQTEDGQLKVRRRWGPG